MSDTITGLMKKRKEYDREWEPVVKLARDTADRQERIDLLREYPLLGILPAAAAMAVAATHSVMILVRR